MKTPDEIFKNVSIRIKEQSRGKFIKKKLAQIKKRIGFSRNIQAANTALTELQSDIKKNKKITFKLK